MRRLLSRVTGRFRERGQVLVLAAVLLPVLLGMAGMAVDIGSYSSDRRSLQNAADAIALAGAQGLCRSSCSSYDEARAEAQAILDRYEINPSHVTIEPSGGSSAPQVRVTIQRPHNFTFIKVLGVASSNVEARATAVKVSFGGGDDIVPFAVTQAAFNSATSGDEIVLKYDANNPTTGNFGPIRIDIEGGAGSNDYETMLKYGSEHTACAEGTTNCSPEDCPGEFPEECAEDALGCDGPECKANTGNKVGGTRDGVDFRLANTISSCDTFEEAFSVEDTSGTNTEYRLNNECNPWIDGPGGCTDDAEGTLCSRRVIIIPIIDEFPNGSGDMTIIKFALFFLEGYGDDACTGNSCEITGRFIYAEFSTGAISGAYDPGASIQFVRLVE